MILMRTKSKRDPTIRNAAIGASLSADDSTGINPSIKPKIEHLNCDWDYKYVGICWSGFWNSISTTTS